MRKSERTNKVNVFLTNSLNPSFQVIRVWNHRPRSLVQTKTSPASQCFNDGKSGQATCTYHVQLFSNSLYKTQMQIGTSSGKASLPGDILRLKIYRSKVRITQKEVSLYPKIYIIRQLEFYSHILFLLISITSPMFITS